MSQDLFVTQEEEKEDDVAPVVNDEKSDMAVTFESVDKKPTKKRKTYTPLPPEVEVDLAEWY